MTDLVTWLKICINDQHRDEIDRIITVIPERDSVREGWRRAVCMLCDWSTTGMEPIVEAAGYEHADDNHGDLPAMRLATAHRQIVDLHGRSHECSTIHGGNCTWVLELVECSTLLLLASIYAARPDFDPAWVVEVTSTSEGEQRTVIASAYSTEAEPAAGLGV